MTTTLIHVLVNLAFFAVGFYLGNRQNKSRMAKLANDNIDLIESVDSLSKKSDERLKLNHELLERHSKLKKTVELYESQRSELIIRCSNIVENNNQLKLENEAMKFQLEQNTIS